MLSFEFRNSRAQVAALWISLSVAAGYLYAFNPAEGTHYLTCPFRLLTGLSCPGCGTLRALHQLLHGHALAAFRLNPMMMLALPFVVYALVSFTKAGLWGQGLPRVFVPARYIWTLLVLIVGFWILRNTAVYPFPS